MRRVKHTRYRDANSEAIVRYPRDIWPGIVSHELAMKALGRLEQNQLEAVRHSKHAGMSFSAGRTPHLRLLRREHVTAQSRGIQRCARDVTIRLRTPC